MRNRVKRLAIVLLVLTLVFSMSAVFTGCSDDSSSKSDGTTYNVSGVIDDGGVVDVTNIRLKAGNRTTAPNEDGEWRLTGIPEGEKIIPVLDVDAEPKVSDLGDISFEPESFDSVTSNYEGIEFRVRRSGGLVGVETTHIDYSEDKDETEIRIDFDRIIEAYDSKDELKEAITIEGLGDDVEFIAQLYSDRDDATSREKRFLYIIIDERVQEEVRVKIAPNTLKTVDNDGEEIGIREITTEWLQLSTDNVIERNDAVSTDNIKVIDNDKKEIEVLAKKNPSLRITRGNVEMPLVEVLFEQLKTRHEAAEIITIAGKRIDSDTGQRARQGDKLRVRAQNGEVAEYDIILNTNTDVQSDKNLRNNDAYLIEDGVIKENDERIYDTMAIDDFIDWLELSCSHLDIDDINDAKVVTKEDYENNSSFNDLTDLRDGAFDIEKDYLLVVRDLRPKNEIYDIEVVEASDNTDLENANDSIIRKVDNQEQQLIVASHLSDEDLAEDLFKYVSPKEGASIVEEESDNKEVTVIAENGRDKATYEIRYAPLYREAAVFNSDPYVIYLDISKFKVEEDDDGNLIPEGDTDFGDVRFRDRFSIEIEGEHIAEYSDMNNANRSAKVKEAKIISPGDYYEMLKLELDSKIIEGDEIKISYEVKDDRYFFYDEQILPFTDKPVSNYVDAADYNRMPRTIRSENADEIIVEFKNDYDLKLNGNASKIAEAFEVLTYKDRYYNNILGVDHPISGDENPVVNSVEVIEIPDSNNNRIRLRLDKRILPTEQVAVRYIPNPYQDYDILTVANDNYSDKIVANGFGRGYGEYSDEGKSVSTDISYAEMINAVVRDKAGTEIRVSFDSNISISNVESDLDSLFELENQDRLIEGDVDGELISSISKVANNTIVLHLNEGVVERDKVDSFDLTYQPQLRTEAEVNYSFLTDSNNNPILHQKINVDNRVRKAEYANARVREGKDHANKVEIFFSANGEEVLDNNNPKRSIEINTDNLADGESIEDYFTVEGNLIRNINDDDYNFDGDNYEVESVEWDNTNNKLVLELNTYVKAEDNVNVSYDDSAQILRDRYNDYLPVDVINVTLNADDSSNDGAINQVEPLKIVGAATVGFEDREIIRVGLNKDLVDIHGDSNLGQDGIIFSGDEASLVDNFEVIVDGDRNQTNVANVKIKGNSEYHEDFPPHNEINTHLEIVLTKSINQGEDDARVELRYNEDNINSRIKYLSDNRNNYLSQADIEVYNNIEMPKARNAVIHDRTARNLEFSFANASKGIDEYNNLAVLIDGTEDEEAQITVNQTGASVNIYFGRKIEEGERVTLRGGFRFDRYVVDASDIDVVNYVDGPRVNSAVIRENQANEIEVDFKGSIQRDGSTDQTVDIVDRDKVKDAFSVSVAGSEVEIENITESNNILTLELAKSVLADSDVTIDYTNNNSLADNYGNKAPGNYSGSYQVANNAQYVDRANKAELTADSKQIIIEMDSRVSYQGDEQELDFRLVHVNNEIAKIDVDGSQITLTLEEAIDDSTLQNFTVRYLPGFENKLVTNNGAYIVDKFSLSVANE